MGQKQNMYLNISLQDFISENGKKGPKAKNAILISPANYYLFRWKLYLKLHV